MACFLRDATLRLSRANVMKQATSSRHLKLPMLLRGIEIINTSPTDYHPIRQVHMMRLEAAAGC